MAYRDAVVREGETITIRDWQTGVWIVFLPVAIGLTLLFGFAWSWLVPGVVLAFIVLVTITSTQQRRAPFMLSWKIVADAQRDHVSIVARPVFARTVRQRFALSEITGVDVRPTMNDYGKVMIVVQGELVEVTAAHMVMCREIAAVLENVRASARRRSTP